MKARLVDVAREAGVSAKTVSNFINGYPFITPETAQKVQDAIAKLDYVPNRSARTLRTGRMGIIGLALPDLNMPYFAELATQITSAAEDRGYTILIDITAGERERELRAASGLRPHAIDGLILSPLSMGKEEVAAAAAGGTPLVLLGEWERPADVPYVGVDNVEAAVAATQHLMSLGRRRIAAIGPVGNRPHGTSRLRLKGYLRALEEAGLPHDPDLYPELEVFNREQGAVVAQRLLALENPPDAMFCFSDLLAIGALRVLNERGIKVPEDIAVLGWDDIAEAHYSWPPISSIRPDTDLIASTAVDLILRQLDGVPIDAPEVYVAYALIARQSTGSA